MSYEEAKEIKRKRAFDWPSEQGEDDQKDLEGEDNNNGVAVHEVVHLAAGGVLVAVVVAVVLNKIQKDEGIYR